MDSSIDPAGSLDGGGSPEGIREVCDWIEFDVLDLGAVDPVVGACGGEDFEDGSEEVIEIGEAFEGVSIDCSAEWGFEVTGLFDEGCCIGGLIMSQGYGGFESELEGFGRWAGEFRNASLFEDFASRDFGSDEVSEE